MPGQPNPEEDEKDGRECDLGKTVPRHDVVWMERGQRRGDGQVVCFVHTSERSVFGSKGKKVQLWAKLFFCCCQTLICDLFTTPRLPHKASLRRHFRFGCLGKELRPSRATATLQPTADGRPNRSHIA